MENNIKSKEAMLQVGIEQLRGRVTNILDSNAEVEVIMSMDEIEETLKVKFPIESRADFENFDKNMLGNEDEIIRHACEKAMVSK